MQNNSSFRKDTFFYGLATLGERLVSFFILPLLTKTLSQDLYGVWTQMITTTGLLCGIVLLGFQTASVKFLSGKKDPAEASSTFHKMLSITLLNSLVILIAIFIFKLPLSSLMFGNADFSNFVILFGFYLVGESLFELIVGFLRAQNKIALLSLYYFLKNAVRITMLVAGLILLKLDLAWALVLIISLQFLFILTIYIVNIVKQAGFKFSAGGYSLKKIMLFSLPLVPYAVVVWANNFIDRYFILHYFDITQVSIYAVAFSLMAIGAVFYSIPSFVLYPRMAGLYNDGKIGEAGEILGKVVKLFLFLSIPFLFTLSVLSEPVTKLLSTPDYVSSWKVFFFLGCGILMFGMHQLSTYCFVCAGKTVLSFQIMLISFICNFFANLFLIPVFGILGAAIANFISNSVLAVISIIKAKKFINYSFPWESLLKTFFATGVITVFLLAAKIFFDMNKTRILVFFVLLAMVIYLALDLLLKNSVLRELKRKSL